MLPNTLHIRERERGERERQINKDNTNMLHKAEISSKKPLQQTMGHIACWTPTMQTTGGHR